MLLRTPFILLLFLAAMVRADVPLAPSLLNPLSAAEAWNVIRLASTNVERLIKEKRPLEVPPQISLLSPALRVLAKSPVKEGKEAMLDAQTTAAFKMVNQMAKEAMAENTSALAGFHSNLRTSLTELASGFEPALIEGELYHCPQHTDFISPQPAQICPRCAQRLQVRRIPYSFIHARPEAPTIRMSTHYEAPRLTLKLSHADGSPLLKEDLWLTHTQLVQVLAHGPGYVHLSAEPSGTPGEYVCDFTPSAAGAWTIHAGLTPASTGLPEYPAAELTLAQTPKPTPTQEVRMIELEGFQFQLSVAGTKGTRLRATQTQALQLVVKDAAGQPVTRLEPLQQAFAHIDAFYAGSPTLLQLHPTGGDILREDLRGGPGLSFRIYSPEAGWLRLYCRVRIDGKDLTVPFLLQIYP
jgi:hypothetical protein